MATTTVSNNATASHVIFTTSEEEVALPISDCVVLVEGDRVRINRNKRTVHEFDSVDSNLVGATTALRLADLYTTYLVQGLGGAGSIGLPVTFQNTVYPADPPHHVMAHYKFDTTLATDQFLVDVNQWVQPELGVGNGLMKVEAVMIAFEPGALGPVPDAEDYKCGFPLIPGVPSAPFTSVREQIIIKTPVNFITGFGWDGTSNLTIDVTNGSSPTNIRYEVHLRLYFAHNVV